MVSGAASLGATGVDDAVERLANWQPRHGARTAGFGFVVVRIRCPGWC